MGLFAAHGLSRVGVLIKCQRAECLFRVFKLLLGDSGGLKGTGLLILLLTRRLLCQCFLVSLFYLLLRLIQKGGVFFLHPVNCFVIPPLCHGYPAFQSAQQLLLQLFDPFRRRAGSKSLCPDKIVFAGDVRLLRFQLLPALGEGAVITTVGLEYFFDLVLRKEGIHRVFFCGGVDSRRVLRAGGNFLPILYRRILRQPLFHKGPVIRALVLCQKLAQIGIGAAGVHVQRPVKILRSLLPLAVLQGHIAPVDHGAHIGAAGDRL